MMMSISFFFSAISLISALGLLALALLDLFHTGTQFWPPPNKSSWQIKAFKTLFRFMVYGLLMASAVHIWKYGFQSTSGTTIIAFCLLLAGFMVAFLATKQLGWRQAFGEDETLTTTGIFRYSRNPIYLATFFGLAGWALLLPDFMIVATLTTWAALYIVAVRLEERALQKQYGSKFAEYCRRVRRFI